MFQKKMIGFAMALLLVAALAQAQTADEILAKHVKASGGEAKLRAINSLEVKGTFSIPAYNLTMDYTVSQKRPNFMKMESEMPGGMKIVNAVNGDQVWMVNSFAGMPDPTVVTDKDTLDAQMMQADIDGFYFDRAKKGITAKYVGLETLDGEQLHHVSIAYKSGLKVEAYFDPASGLLRRTSTIVKQMGQEFEATAFYSDYREVQGMIFAHQVDQTMGPQSMTITTSSITINPKIDNKIFAMPAPVEKKPTAAPAAKPKQ